MMFLCGNYAQYAKNCNFLQKTFREQKPDLQIMRKICRKYAENMPQIAKNCKNYAKLCPELHHWQGLGNEHRDIV